MHIDKTFYKGGDPLQPQQGYFIDDNLYYNVKNYLIPAVKNKFDAIIAISGMEGCQPKGSQVLMADGSWKAIEDVKIGDKVISPQEDGTTIVGNVIRTCDWYSPMNYDVVSLNKRQKLYSCSFNHNIPIMTATKGLQKFQAIDYNRRKKSMKKNDISFLSPLIDSFGHSDCEIDPYSLGVFLSNGSFVSQGSSKLLNITMNIDDRNSYEYMFSIYPPNKAYQKANSKGVTFKYSIKSNFAVQLEKVGLFNKRSGDKFIPKSALLSSADYRKALLAGIIDTDGSYTKKGNYDFLSKSKQLTTDVKFLVHTLGGRVGEVKECKKGIKRTGFVGTYYRISFYIGNLSLPIRLARKKRNGYNIFYKSPNRKSIDVVATEPGYVFGIELDTPSHWYITDNWMVTSNSGKSTMAQTIGYFCDPTLNVDRVVFDANELLKRIDESKPGQCIIFDEAVMGMMSQDASTAMQNVLIKKFVTIRKKRLYIIIVIPTIFMLRKYFAIFRTRCLIHTFTPDGITRGYFKFYGYNTKRLLYIRGIKEFDQGLIREDFAGKFVDTEGFFVNVDEYDFKKEEAIQRITASLSDKKLLTAQHILKMKERNLLLMLFYKYYKHSETMMLKLRGRPIPEDLDKQIDTKFLALLKARIKMTMSKKTLDKNLDLGLNYLDMVEKKEFDKKKKLEKIRFTEQV